MSDFLKSKGVFIIAEIAQTHDGSLGQAHAFIDAVARTGADAIKFQTHIASEESTVREPWRVHFSKQDKTRFDYWRRMEFSEEEWLGLKNHAEEKGLVFLSSPFSSKAVELLMRLGMKAWKIGSGEIDNEIMMDQMIATGLPLIVSTGMSGWEEIDRIYGKLKSSANPFCLLHCTTEYPVKPEHFGLNIITEFKNRYDCPIGLSSHLPEVAPHFAATTLGISVLEVHVTFSRAMFGPDVSSSFEMSELSELVRGIRLIENVLSHPVDKDALSRELAPVRAIFRKSLVVAHDLPAGHMLGKDDIAFKKPGDGLSVKEWKNVLGKRLARAKNQDDALTSEDIS
jgi:N,N'-diacetyllegionaminate synthase